MSPEGPHPIYWLAGGILVTLLAATGVGVTMSALARGREPSPFVANYNARVASWWVMCAVLAVGIAGGVTGAAIFFGFVSFLALREFMALVPSRSADHRTLLAIFFVITPLQYLFVALRWYGLYSIAIPVYASLFIPARSALRGDSERFLERNADLQWGAMICVYCLSYAPALLALLIPAYNAAGGGLLLFLLVVVESSDVLQFVWGKALGRRKIAPTISPNKTWEGFLGGVLCATALGAALWWITPFRPWQAGAMALVITLMGFAGGLTMSAIKCDRGIKDFGNLIPGHGGVMDRIDSLCFAAPVFFHLTRFHFAKG
jgi:phosphatidate cytidylyltransferase